MHPTDTRAVLPETPRARDAVRRLPGSLIREVADAGNDGTNLLAFWFGEPDETTPDFIREAAREAIAAGDTFYRPNLGDPALRAALADYLSGLHRPVSANRIAVTSGGVNALMLAGQLLLSPGDRAVAVVPLWPNLTAIPELLGAHVERIALRLDIASGRWTLDLEQLLAAVTPTTRMLILNSPSNPTGWTLKREEMATLLAHCRRTGTWILSDEAYGRLVFDGSRCAPSMLDLATPDDRLIVADTFSKTWRMTGWRLGWLVLPESLVADVAKLIEFNTSCAPGFVQQAALAALRAGDAPVRAFVASLHRRRDALVDALGAIPGIRLGTPDGAMYAFFGIDGMADSLQTAKALVAHEGLGLAPGAAFGPEGEGHLRWCFAQPIEALREGAARLSRFLAARR